jgi:hypothetical protein
MPSELPFEVYEYDFDHFASILAEKCEVHLDVVLGKDHVSFFEEYFSEMEAATILVENHYVDHDYLDDYAAYYAKCFQPYGRFCHRLHIFKTPFLSDQFSSFLAGEIGSALSEKTLQDSYLGFIVLKPLPETFIGRTCLATYDSDSGRRSFPTTRRYDTHLFGTSLFIDSVAFQEQDKIVAACATSALWSVFQSTGKLFHHSIPSPVEITRAATFSNDVTRSFPNSGLNLEQMATAIRMVSLEPFVVEVRRPHVLKATAYAYLRGHVPLLLSVDLVDTGQQMFPELVLEATNTESLSVMSLETEASEISATHPPTEHLEQQNDIPTESQPDSNPDLEPETRNRALRFPVGTSMDSHAVALAGFSLGETQPICYGEKALLLKAMRINKLYAHDDGIGPFARMEFNDDGFLNTSWRGDASGKTGTVVAAPDCVLVPLYNKIRIPLDVVIDAVSPFDDIIEDLRSQGTLEFSTRLEWDIFLTSSVELKTELRGDDDISGDYRSLLLLTKMPRFIWRAVAEVEGKKVVQFLFDATDIEQGKFFLMAIEHDVLLAGVLRELSNELSEQFRRNRAGRIAEWYFSRNAEEVQRNNGDLTDS